MSRRKRRGNGFRNFLIFLIVLLIAATGLVIWLCLNFVFDAPAAPLETTIQTAPVTEPPVTEAPTTEPPTEPPTTMPEPEHIISTAAILSTGDLLMHTQILENSVVNGVYDFSGIFPYITEYVTAADYAAANLETTLSGAAKPYQGNPKFNCPDAILDAVQNAGFDMLLTANNHSYDTEQYGFERTLRTVREHGLATLGTQLSAEEPKFVIQDINGIRVGMICYTYEDSYNAATPPSLNYNPMNYGGYELVNCFRHREPEIFCAEMEQRIAEMKAGGAEAILLYIHWGEEYKLAPTNAQTSLAQKLCDLGVDIIIGSHPHVVEPVELLTSSVDPSHKTVCLYSMGNAVSNQRQGNLTSITTPHTEDGVLFSVTFSKYSDGAVYLEDVQLIPTWVRAADAAGNTVVRNRDAVKRYIILPLDDARRSQWQEQFGIDENTLTLCNDSWQRTMDLVGSGMNAVQEYLYAERTAREAFYLRQAGSGQ